MGEYDPPRRGGGYTSLIEHWDGKSWQVVPDAINSNRAYLYNLVDLHGVVALSKENVWAVGDLPHTEADYTLIERWDGRSWKIVLSPNVPNYASGLNSIMAVSARNIWAVGGAAYPHAPFNGSPLIEHWDGTAWKIVASGGSASDQLSYLFGIAILSANNIWAAGVSNRQSSIEHWDGSKWHTAASPSIIGYSNLAAITNVPGTSQVWTVGSQPSSSVLNGISTLIEFHP